MATLTHLSLVLVSFAINIAFTSRLHVSYMCNLKLYEFTSEAMMWIINTIFNFIKICFYWLGGLRVNITEKMNNFSSL
jgi:hypothetical protein